MLLGTRIYIYMSHFSGIYSHMKKEKILSVPSHEISSVCHGFVHRWIFGRYEWLFDRISERAAVNEAFVTLQNQNHKIGT